MGCASSAHTANGDFDSISAAKGTVSPPLSPPFSPPHSAINTPLASRASSRYNSPQKPPRPSSLHHPTSPPQTGPGTPIAATAAGRSPGPPPLPLGRSPAPSITLAEAAYPLELLVKTPQGGAATRVKYPHVDLHVATKRTRPESSDPSREPSFHDDILGAMNKSRRPSEPSPGPKLAKPLKMQKREAHTSVHCACQAKFRITTKLWYETKGSVRCPKCLASYVIAARDLGHLPEWQYKSLELGLKLNFEEDAK